MATELKTKYVFVFGPDNLDNYQARTIERLIKLIYHVDPDRYTGIFNTLTKAEISEALNNNIICIPDETVQTFTKRIHANDVFAERIVTFENDQQKYLYNMLINALDKSEDEAHEILENAAYIYDSSIPNIGVYICGMGLRYRESTKNDYGYIEVTNDGIGYEGLVLVNRNAWFLHGDLSESLFNLKDYIFYNLKK